MKINISVLFLCLTLFFACDPNGNDQTTDGQNQKDSTQQEMAKKQQDQTINSELQQNKPAENEADQKPPHHYICYKNDSNPDMMISISFDIDEKAQKVRYKGQEASMSLQFLKEDFQKGGAHPNIETYYTEMYEGKENGTYKLIHSGIWDYAEYTRKNDGKQFNFTIDHDLSVENDEYRTTPCF